MSRPRKISRTIREASFNLGETDPATGYPTARVMRYVANKAATSERHRMALIVAFYDKRVPCPLVRNIPSGEWIVWSGRNNLYRYLKAIGLVWNGKTGFWEQPV